MTSGVRTKIRSEKFHAEVFAMQLKSLTRFFRLDFQISSARDWERPSLGALRSSYRSGSMALSKTCCHSLVCFLQELVYQWECSEAFIQHAARPLLNNWSRSGRKGGFSKSGFCQKNKNTQGHWAQQYLWHSKRYSQERRIFQKAFSWFLSRGVAEVMMSYLSRCH